MSYDYTPRKRLRDYQVGDKLRLAGMERDVTITAVREDGYIDLAPGVTACAGHPVEEKK